MTVSEAALSETAEQEKPRNSDEAAGGRDEASVEEELDDLLRMDIQNVNAECFRAFSW